MLPAFGVGRATAPEFAGANRSGTSWLSGVQAPARIATIIAAIGEQSAAEGRPIDDDHYGAGFAYRFGSSDVPIVQRAAAALSRVADAGDPRDYIGVADASDIRACLDEYIAGASKFVLRPLAETPEEVFAQTDRLIEEVVPAVDS